MKTFLLLLGGFVVGALVSLVLATGVLTGIGAGVGVATGLKAGACLTVEASKDKGLITSEQVGEVLQAAAQLIAKEDLGDSGGFANGDAECGKFIAEMKAAAAG